MNAPISFDPPESMRLPRNVEAEAALLGALMIDNRLIDDVRETLTADHFFEPVHGRIYAAPLTLSDNRMVVNPVTMRPMFDSDPGMEALGGPGYLAQLTGSGAALIGARDFARQIYELALLRELFAVGRTLMERALDTSQAVDPGKQIEEAEALLYKVSVEGGTANTVKSFTDASRTALQMAEKALNSGGVAGVTTGFESINARIGGMHHSDLMILAGRPGMGKTSLATNIAFNAARRYMDDVRAGIDPKRSIGAKVAFFSLEMSADQLAMRILSEQSKISSQELRKGNISQAEFHALAAAAAKLEALPLYFDDTAGLTITGLHTRVRRLQAKHQGTLGLVVVDYLQLLSGSGARASDNRVQEISEISRGLKTLAKDLNVPVLALSQLSRAVESREDKRPQLSDLRESGSIEQDADMVWFVYRDDYYLQQHEPGDAASDAHSEWAAKMDAVFGKAELLIAKQRHGATGKVMLKFESNITLFSDLD